MDWWQILLAVVLNVPWLYLFFVCVVLPSARTIVDKFDKKQFRITMGGLAAVLVSASAVVLLLSLMICLIMGDTIQNSHKLFLTIAISGGITLLSSFALIIINRRR